MPGLQGKVLIADGQLMSRMGLATLLEQDVGFTDVVQVVDFEAAMAALGSDQGISLAAIDLSLPNMGSLEALRLLRITHPALRIVVLSSALNRTDVLKALSAGVHGVLSKTMGRCELAAAFGLIAEGQIFVPALIAEIIAGPGSEPPVERCSRAMPAREHSPALTVRQSEVLDLLTMGYSNKEIARALKIAESTVKVHVTAAYRFLGVQDRAAATAVIAEALSPRGRTVLPAPSLWRRPARRRR